MIQKKMLQPWAIPGVRRIHMPIFRERLSPELIQEVILEYFNMSLEQVCGKTSRNVEIMYCRQMIQYMVYFNCQMSLKDTARFARPNKPYTHATVINSCKAIKDRADTDKNVRHDISQILLRLRGRTENYTVGDALLSEPTKPHLKPKTHVTTIETAGLKSR